MKTTSFLWSAAFLALTYQAVFAQALPVSEALKKGYLSLVAEGSGGHSGESLQLKLTNQSKKKLEIKIPAGQVFLSGDTTLQDLMVVKEELFALETGKTRIARVNGFCIEASNGSPGAGAIFKVGKMAEGALLKVAEYLNENKLYDHPSAQYAIWSVSDNERLEGIGDEAMAKYIAGLLGKAEPSYQVQYQPQDRLLPGQPANLRDAVAMNGLFYYELTKDQKVDFGLYNGEGKLIHTLFQNRLQKRGRHKFRFNFEIKNLPKGKYAARLTSEGKTLKELEVEF